MRSEYADSKYTFIYYSYLKEVPVKYKEHAAFAFLDDKTSIPLGEPDPAV